MTFVFDRHIAPRVVNAMKVMGVDGAHLDEQFPQTARDVDWVPQVAANGSAVVSIDRRMNRNPEERKMLGECGVLAFFLASGFAKLSAWEQLIHLARAWEKIEAKAANPGRDRLFLVSVNGTVVPIR